MLVMSTIAVLRQEQQQLLRTLKYVNGFKVS